MRTNMKERHGTSPKRWALLIIKPPDLDLMRTWGSPIPGGCTAGYFISPLRGEENEDATIPGGCTAGYFISPLRGEENEDDRTGTIETSLRANPSGPDSLVDHIVSII